ncbi:MULTISPECIES: hypothetical protein [Roseomonadaceae]|jgi:hypothetical protein|uniref:Uncharacterized protein n=1 Tax=Falsiroseomonas oleicola TaxID=2801474 RepID=A0ABS6HE99_9PROT|nr:hypothetical protein [Roseomonas oleicola]MBU8546008.1 hypothetical protein [Roseomonas oleicola]
MPTLRIEAQQDAASGLFFLEVFLPAESPTPFVSTAPRYSSAAAAEQDMIATLTAAANRPRKS